MFSGAAEHNKILFFRHFLRKQILCVCVCVCVCVFEIQNATWILVVLKGPGAFNSFPFS